jgi:hypothetical protein
MEPRQCVELFLTVPLFEPGRKLHFMLCASMLCQITESKHGTTLNRRTVSDSRQQFGFIGLQMHPEAFFQRMNVIWINLLIAAIRLSLSFPMAARYV